MRLRSSLLFFVGKAILFLIGIAIVWYFIYPAYSDLLAATANLLPPAHTKIINFGQDTIQLLRTDYPKGHNMYGYIDGLDLQYGLLIVLALIAATPGLRLMKRLKFVLIAFVVMFLIHIASILVFAKVASSAFDSPAKIATINNNPYLILFCIIGPGLFPALVWMALAFRQFFPKTESNNVKLQKKT